MLSEGDLTALPQHLAEVRGGDRTVRFEGPWLADVLEGAGVTFGHGPGLTRYVIVEAADGCSVVYALAELDPQFIDSNVLLAVQQDGAALSSDEGPFRLIASSHRHPARWVRQVGALRVRQRVFLHSGAERLRVGHGRATARAATKISRGLTPPWHLVPNPRYVEGWHFRNASNTGPNDGSVNAPQETREFIFSPEVGRCRKFARSVEAS